VTALEASIEHLFSQTLKSEAHTKRLVLEDHLVSIDFSVTH